MLISEMGFSATKPPITPLEVNQRLTSVEFDKIAGLQSSNALVDVTSYQKLIGKLLYLTVTRHNICYAVQSLCQFMQAPKKSYMDIATRIVRYHKNAPGLRVLLKRAYAQSLLGF